MKNKQSSLCFLWLSQVSMLPRKHFRDKEDRYIGLSLWLYYNTVLGLCLLSTFCVNVSLWEIKSFSPDLDYRCLTGKKGILFSFCFFQDWLRSLLVIICLSDLFFKVGKASNGFPMFVLSGTMPTVVHYFIVWYISAMNWKWLKTLWQA